MKCCQRQAERKVKKYKKKDNIVYPETIKPEKNLINETLEFNADEKIKCGGCNDLFSLSSNDLKIHCNLCSQFFHCKIAGKCDGEACNVTLRNGEKHRASYCYDCTGLISDNKILCKDCFMTTHLEKKL